MARENRQNKKQLSSSDREVWQALAKTVTAYDKPKPKPQADNLVLQPTTNAGSQLDPDTAQTRQQAASRRASDEDLRELLAEQNRKLSRFASDPNRFRLTSSADDFLRPGALQNVDRRTANRLRAGKIPVEARMDLHGMTRDKAFAAVNSFITTSAAKGKRCVILVTGKGLGQHGGGVLWREVPQWLNLPQNRQCIISYSYAQARDGGSGALYIYLKRPERRKT